MTDSTQFPIGLDGHDRLKQELGGGIPRGAIVLIEGDYGAGKSVISQRLSYGFTDEDITVTFISTELSVRGFLDQMHSLEYNMVRPLLNEEILYIHAELDSGGALSGQERDRKELLRRLMEAEEVWNGDVIIVDTFDAILRNDPQFEALVRQNEERQAALEIISFFREVTSQGKTVILTVDPTTVDEETMGPFRSIADVFIELEMVEVGNDVRRNIFVKRFAGMGEQVGDRIGFSVRSGIGIVIESRSVA
ncbi:ATPase domain-containing protein [Salinigranum marinum]|uniref:ATPase domain-containing protein n=1 Tax=Salinigranum marinum TaxID=1515595 RepID=UPI0029899FDA|nr:ATPase domain-containing protein [Salinigranum marinum]